MIAPALALVVALVAAPAPAASSSSAPSSSPKKPRALLVMDLATTSGVADAQTIGTITHTLAVSVQKRPGVSVLTGEDVKRMAQVEADKQVLGCDAASASCIAEIAGAMGADLVLYGDVGKLSDLYVVNLNLFDAGQAKAIGRQSVQVRAFDEAFIAQLDIAVRTLLAPVTGESTGVTLAPTSGASVPTIDLEALKSSGLKAINMDAERALETALDAQDDKSGAPEKKRDAWCALAQVQGANPYLEAATKACSDWKQFVVANADVEKNMSADYQTLAGFLSLKRKSKEQKLEACDSFLKSYEHAGDRPMLRAVKDARANLASYGSATLPDLAGSSAAAAITSTTSSVGTDGTVAGAGPNAARAGDDDAPGFVHFGLYGIHLERLPGGGPVLGADVTTDFGAPAMNVGLRLEYAFLELGGGAAIPIAQSANGATITPTAFAGLRGIYVGLGPVGVINPSVGVEYVAVANPPPGVTVLKPYVSNMFSYALLDVAVYWSHTTLVGDGAAHVTAEKADRIGVQLFIDIAPFLYSAFD